MKSTTNRNRIVCPYCRYEHELNSDYFETGDEFEDNDFDCSGCGKYFNVYGTVDFEYWSISTPLPEDER